MTADIVFHSSFPLSAEADCKIDTASSPYLSFFSSSWLMLTSCPEASWDFLVMDSSSVSKRTFSLAMASTFFSPERTLPSSAGRRERRSKFVFFCCVFGRIYNVVMCVKHQINIAVSIFKVTYRCLWSIKNLCINSFYACKWNAEVLFIQNYLFFHDSWGKVNNLYYFKG